MFNSIRSRRSSIFISQEKNFQEFLKLLEANNSIINITIKCNINAENLLKILEKTINIQTLAIENNQENGIELAKAIFSTPLPYLISLNLKDMNLSSSIQDIKTANLPMLRKFIADDNYLSSKDAGHILSSLSLPEHFKSSNNNNVGSDLSEHITPKQLPNLKKLILGNDYSSKNRFDVTGLNNLLQKTPHLTDFDLGNKLSPNSTEAFLNVKTIINLQISHKDLLPNDLKNLSETNIHHISFSTTVHQKIIKIIMNI
ncbi:MAG: hypothetical protein RCG15_03925 [Candidatus Rickettsia vulgarisii]